MNSRDAPTVCWTGADKEWQTPNFIMERPFVPTDTAQWLVDRDITIFATDLIGMDDPHQWWWPLHGGARHARRLRYRLRCGAT